MNLLDMNKDERSLLLYLETRAVDYGGRTNSHHMNANDYKILEKWNKSGFIESGRIAAEDCNRDGANWCHLSEEAWKLAHEERRARAKRMWEDRPWKTTAKKRGQPVEV